MRTPAFGRQSTKISRRRSSRATSSESGISIETVPPRFSGSRGVFTRHPCLSAISISLAVCRLDFSRIRGTPTSREVRSEEHTSELQSLRHLVCRLLLEDKKKRVPTWRERAPFARLLDSPAYRRRTASRH